jgi:hypothetical protein
MTRLIFALQTNAHPSSELKKLQHGAELMLLKPRLFGFVHSPAPGLL